MIHWKLKKQFILPKDMLTFCSFLLKLFANQQIHQEPDKVTNQLSHLSCKSTVYCLKTQNYWNIDKLATQLGLQDVAEALKVFLYVLVSFVLT